MQTGWISIYRKIQDCEFWLSDKFSRGQAWVDLLLLATHKPRYFFIRGIKVDVGRGQLCISQKELADRWGWSNNKVANFMKLLQSEGMVDIKVNHKISLYSIVNYEKYQNDQPQTQPQKRYKSVTNSTTYNNDNNVNNVNKGKEAHTTPSAVAAPNYEEEALKWLEHYREVRKEPKRKSITSFIKNFTYWRGVYSLEEMIEALDNAHKSPFHDSAMNPDFFFRTRNKNGECDYIGDLLSAKSDLEKELDGVEVV